MELYKGGALLFITIKVHEMFIVLVHSWQQQESDVTDIIANAMNANVYEVRQKIAGGGPTVLTSYADPEEAEALANTLVQAGVPSFVVDRGEVRSQAQPFRVSRFIFNETSLSLESFNKEQRELSYDTLTLILVATYLLEQEEEIEPKKKRKFSFRRRKKEKTIITPERDETLWLYAQGEAAIRFDRLTVNFDGLGADIQLTRELNFNYLKKELRNRSENAIYDERLIRRSGLVNLLGPTLNPEHDLDLAFEMLSKSLSVTEDIK